MNQISSAAIEWLIGVSDGRHFASHPSQRQALQEHGYIERNGLDYVVTRAGQAFLAERQLADKRATLAHRIQILEALQIVGNLRAGGIPLDLAIDEACRNTGLEAHEDEIRSTWIRL